MLSQLTNQDLLRKLVALLSGAREVLADFLAHLAEVDARELFLPAGYPTMHAYCVGELHLSEETTNKRLRVARKARQFPALFDALRDGRLHSSAVIQLSPYLTAANVDALIAAATHRTRTDIEIELARRFPRAEALRLDEGLSALPSDNRESARYDLSPGTSPKPRTKVEARTEQSFVLQVTISSETHAKLRYAQDLLSHAVPNRDASVVLDRALDALIEKHEKRKFAATAKPARRPRNPTRSRTIPAEVKRQVRERDRNQCTFTSPTGHRCGVRAFLEFDHIDPVALGGESTVDNLRMRCRAHNQYEAKRTFGRQFMERKREEAMQRRAARREKAAERRRTAEGNGRESPD